MYICAIFNNTKVVSSSVTSWQMKNTELEFSLFISLKCLYNFILRIREVTYLASLISWSFP